MHLFSFNFFCARNRFNGNLGAPRNFEASHRTSTPPPLPPLLWQANFLRFFPSRDCDTAAAGSGWRREINLHANKCFIVIWMVVFLLHHHCYSTGWIESLLACCSVASAQSLFFVRNFALAVATFIVGHKKGIRSMFGWCAGQTMYKRNGGKHTESMHSKKRRRRYTREVMLNIWKLVVQIHRTCSIQLKQNRARKQRSVAGRDGSRCIHNILKMHLNSSVLNLLRFDAQCRTRSATISQLFNASSNARRIREIVASWKTPSECHRLIFAVFFSHHFSNERQRPPSNGINGMHSPPFDGTQMKEKSRKETKRSSQQRCKCDFNESLSLWCWTVCALPSRHRVIHHYVGGAIQMQFHRFTVTMCSSARAIAVFVYLIYCISGLAAPAPLGYQLLAIALGASKSETRETSFANCRRQSNMWTSDTGTGSNKICKCFLNWNRFYPLRARAFIVQCVVVAGASVPCIVIFTFFLLLSFAFSRRIARINANKRIFTCQIILCSTREWDMCTRLYLHTNRRPWGRGREQVKTNKLLSLVNSPLSAINFTVYLCFVLSLRWHFAIDTSIKWCISIGNMINKQRAKRKTKKKLLNGKRWPFLSVGRSLTRVCVCVCLLN